MTAIAPLQNTANKSHSLSGKAQAGLLLQRKCACGGSASSSLAGECEECKKKRLQKKLSIGTSNDPLEQEADRVADQVLAASAHSAVSSAIPSIQRFTAQSMGLADTAPASVDRVLSGSGRPLDAAIQHDMGQRLGHDLSRVRVHSGPAAEQSAREVNAHAYTVGQNIVFGAGRFAPESHEGRRLLAHELTHVVQQSGSDGIGVSQRTKNTTAGLLQRSFWGLFVGDDFPEQVLKSYLQGLKERGKIEDFNESDNKARAIVAAWKRGGSPYDSDLDSARIRVLLIEEMISGFTGDDDEMSILEILERSDNAMLGFIFGDGSIGVEYLNDEFHGEEWDRLKQFYERRFEGGMPKLLQGTIQAKGTPVPLGAPLSMAGFPRPEKLAQDIPEKACVPEERMSMDKINLCCTASMMDEIRRLRFEAIPKVNGAVAALATPNSVSGALASHFGIQPNDIAHVGMIKNQFESMLRELMGDGIRFICSDQNDPMCKKSETERTNASTVPTCSTARPVHIRFCGDYKTGSSGGVFLGSSNNWLRTFIHEYAHAACPGSGLILPANTEQYRGRDPYPPPSDIAIRNADCYAHFALQANESPSFAIDSFAATEKEKPISAEQSKRFSALTPWQLAQISPSTFHEQTGQPTGTSPGIQDFQRASRFAREVFNSLKVTYDIDLQSPILGRDPTKAELAILDLQLSRILALENVPGLVGGAGGRGQPTVEGSSTPSLKGKVKIPLTEQFGIKRYQLEMAIVGMGGQNKAQIDILFPKMWKDYKVPVDTRPQITEQERKIVVLITLVNAKGNPGFYHPKDDIIYLDATTDIKTPGGADVARHEAVHFLGGRDRTREAFKKRFGETQYIPYWSTFEEGTAQMLTQESKPPNEKNSTTTITTKTGPNTEVTTTIGGSAYEEQVETMKKIINTKGQGREKVLQAYFTGNISQEIFELLEKLVRP